MEADGEYNHEEHMKVLLESKVLKLENEQIRIEIKKYKQAVNFLKMFHALKKETQKKKKK